MTDADPSRFEVDRATAEPWVAVAHSARLMGDLLRQVGEPLAGSNFDTINAHYPWERSSDWCRGYLTAALQHMELWADHVAPLRFAEGAVVTHQFRPVQTLSRAAVEAAAQAVWVMDGSSARECALRHLCLVLHDFDEQRKAAPDETKPRVQQARQTLLGRLSPMVTEQDIGRFPGYMETVKRASAVVAKKGAEAGGIADPLTVERLWRASAGSAHGKRWPSIELQIIEPVSEIAPGQFSTVQHADPVAMTQVLDLANAVLTYGVVRFADYSGYEPQLTQMIAAATARLAAVIPRRTDL